LRGSNGTGEVDEWEEKGRGSKGWGGYMVRRKEWESIECRR
jgi:hypothetical protein